MRDERFGRYMPPTDAELKLRRSPEYQKERERLFQALPKSTTPLSTIIFVDGMAVRIPRPQEERRDSQDSLPPAGNLFQALEVHVVGDEGGIKLLTAGEERQTLLLQSGLEEDQREPQAEALP